jgi:hypothetical protein
MSHLGRSVAGGLLCGSQRMLPNPHIGRVALYPSSATSQCREAAFPLLSAHLRYLSRPASLSRTASLQYLIEQ